MLAEDGAGLAVELLNPEWFVGLISDRGYTPAGFARLIGVTPATIHRLIRGTRKASPSLAVRIAVALDASMTSLFRVAP